MDTEDARAELVRCLVCRTVYEKPLEQADGVAGGACPNCGGLGWLAVSIPVDETALADPA